MTATPSVTRFEADLMSELQVTAEQAVQITDQLLGTGICTIDQWHDASFYMSDGFNPIRDFVEFYLEDIEETDLPSYVVVDYDATWECNLRHDFYTINDGETTYFMVRG